MVKTMTKAEVRVKIAKDVLKHLRETWVDSGHWIGNIGHLGLPVDDNAKIHINKLTATCRVCALGACMLSYVRLFNEATIGELIEFNNMATRSRLNKYFTEKQLNDIEATFELRDDKVLPFPPKERLQIIMKQIIKDKGEVNLSKLKELV